MGTLAVLEQLLIYLPPVACLTVILLILRQKEKKTVHKYFLLVNISLLLYTSAFLLWSTDDKASAYLRFINAYAYPIFIFFLGWAIWKFGKNYLALKEKTNKKQVGLILISLLILLLGSGTFFTSTLFASLRERITFSRLNVFDLSIILSSIVFAFTYFRTHSPDILPIALREVFRNMNDAVLVLDPLFRVIRSNSAAKAIFHSIQPGDELNKFILQSGSKLDQIQTDPSKVSEFEINIKGFIYWVRYIPILTQNHPAGGIIILTDITKRKHAEEQLAHNALHDRLTKLPNRALIMDRLNHAMLSAKRDKDYKYAVLSLNLDRFKVINDNLGRQAGDQVLIEIAQRLKKCLRNVDTAARLGGDEFVILLDKISGIRAASEVSLRVLELLSQKILLDEKEVFPSVSIGISMGSPRHLKPDDILREADIALQQAKERGKGQFVIFDKEMHTHISTLFQLETDLHHALEENQFELHYQPILSLPGQGILGFEALLRWNHPQHGFMLPGEFLPEADEPELILPIGYWGIQQACQDLSRWSSKFSFDPPLSLSMNLFRKQLIDPELPNLLQSIFQETNLHPTCLALEIKENVIVDDDPHILDAIQKVKSIGVRLTIDDFGTGYSSLRVLPTYPIDTIKIAPSYVRNISRSTEDYEVVRFIVELGQRLGIEVIAQGIESPHELIEVQSIKCTQGQGSYFSNPLGRAAIDQLLDKISKMETAKQKINPKNLF